jgi:hypothetical protein
LSTLLHSPKWRAKIVEDELWQRADHQVQNWQEQGEDALAIWDSGDALAGRHRGGSLSSAWPSPARRDALVE